MVNNKSNLSAPVFLLQDAIDRFPLTASPEIALSEALELLNQVNPRTLPNLNNKNNNISLVTEQKKLIEYRTCLLIVENERLIGLVTEADFIKFAFLELDFKKVKIGEVMTKDLITLSESDCCDVFSIINSFREHKIRHLPIVNKEDKILGLIAQENITRSVKLSDLLKFKRVKDAIDKNIIYTSPKTLLWDTVKLMVENKSSYVLIAQKDRKNNLQPLGIVTQRDLIQLEALETNLKKTQAKTVMSHPLFSIDIDRSLWIAHREMEKRGIRRLIAFDNSEKLAGILTATNLIQAIDLVQLLNNIDTLQQEVAKRTEKLSVLAERERLISKIAKQINRSLDLDEILNIIVREAKRILQVDRAIVYQFNLDWSGKIGAESVIEENKSIFGEVIKNLECERDWLDKYRQGQIKAIPDTSTLAETDFIGENIYKKYQIAASLVVPILLQVEDKKAKLVEKNLWGILILHQCKAPYQWQVEEAEFLQKLACHLAIAIQHLELVNLLQKELNEREEYEVKLRQIEANFTTQVNQKTAQLQEINQQLQQEIKERKLTEKSLQNINLQLTQKIAELERQNQENLLLSKNLEFLQVCLNLEEAYRAIATFVRPLFPGASGAIFTVDTYQDRVEAVVSWGEDLKSEEIFSLQECWALRRSRSHWVEDIQIGLTCQHVRANKIPSETLCLPMMAGGEAIGLLYFTAKPGNFSEPQRKLASAIAEQTALALANLKLRESLQKSSIHDTLTGLFDRTYTEEFLQQEIARAQRKQNQIGIVVIDIHNFQEYEEIYGREASDRILQEISLLLQQNIRTYDVACRYDNKKIILILPEVTLEYTIKRVKQLKAKIENLNLEYRDRSLSNISLSVGISCFPEHGIDPKILIQVADEALERAKTQTSDRFEIARSYRKI